MKMEVNMIVDENHETLTGTDPCVRQEERTLR